MSPFINKTSRRQIIGRRFFLRSLGFFGLASMSPAFATGACINTAQAWPLWEQFKGRFIQADGRVIDYSTNEQHSTSEGQSYALFFALVANDKTSFAKILEWTKANLCAGDLTARLPAWKWGKRTDNSWGVIDTNSATDADLWIAYSLFLAGDHWAETTYSALGSSLLTLLEKRAVAKLPQLGPMLLPGAQGFEPKENVWRFNPSYLPPFMLAYFSKKQGGVWPTIEKNSLRLLDKSGQNGYAADWVAYKFDSKAGGVWIIDPDKKDLASFDGIRVYTWLGMTAEKTTRQRLLRLYDGMHKLMQSRLAPPQVVKTQTGEVQENAGIGFSAALLPYLQALGESKLLNQQRTRINALYDGSAQKLQSLSYYDAVLLLFGIGWLDNLFRFDNIGQAALKWSCAKPVMTVSK